MCWIALLTRESKSDPPGMGSRALASRRWPPRPCASWRANGGAVVIAADRMREENPRYRQLSREDPQNAAELTQKEAGEWATRLTSNT